MRNFVSSNASRFEASPIRAVLDRATALRGEGNKVIAFSAGEPDFPTPSPIKAATNQAIADDYSHYSSNRGLPGLRKIIANNIAKDTGVNYDFNTEVIITSSGAEALNNAILTFVDADDEVIIPTPAFVSYKNLVNYTGAKFVDVPLRPEEGYQLNANDIEKAITPKTKMIIINNPNNPSGAVYSRESLEAVAKLCVKHDLMVLSDDMYSRLVYDDAEYISMSALPGMKERTVVVAGFSKSYAMTGWRLGYMAADKSLCDQLIRTHQYSTTCSPTFIQQGLVNSLELEQTEIEVTEMIAAFARRRALVLDGLAKIDGLSTVTPKGAFYVMVDVSATGLSGMDFAMRLLEEYYVATVPAIGLGDSCGDYIRISYATSDVDIVEGLALIEKFVKSL